MQYINWKPIVEKHAEKWLSAYNTLEADLRANLPWLARKFATRSWKASFNPTLLRECVEISKLLGVEIHTVMAAQVAYDEGWAGGDNLPGHGCTTVSTPAQFGRNLDYAYPANAHELIYHESIEINGRTFFIEGFAGVLGWLASQSETHTAAFNQAPHMSHLRRGRMPALQWFRQRCIDLEFADTSAVPSEGVITIDTASDFLLHFVKGGRRFLAETCNNRLVWQEGREGETLGQANNYQLLASTPDVWWSDESRQRVAEVTRDRDVRTSLKAVSNAWTIDTLVLDLK